MAHSKKRKRKAASRRAQPFYEALPAPVTPPIALPEVRDYFDEGLATLSKQWRQKWNQVHIWHQSLIWPSSWQKPHWLTGAQHWLGSLRPNRKQVVYAVLQSSAHIFRGLVWLTRHTLRAGLAAVNFIISRSQLAFAGTKMAIQSAAEYAPAFGADFRQYGGRTLRAAFGRRARLLYLAFSIVGVISLAVTGAMIGTSTINSYANDISSPAALLAKKKTGTTILDRNGAVLFEGYGAQATQTITLGELPQALKDATLSAEDPTFYDHPGFSWRGTARAAWVDITHGARAEGGSTLTQQLVKNALLTSHKNFQRKFQELFLSMELERRYSKDQILEMYFNEIYYGQGASGIEAASQTYFHKSARKLSLGESALLAGLPLGPSRFDPNADIEAATGRRDYVLSRMAEFGKITKDQANAAKAQPIVLATAKTTDPASAMTVYAKKLNLRAPHFVFYVLEQLRQQYGDEAVEQGGITVQTSLDLQNQTIAEETIAQRVDALADHHVTNGGLVSLDPLSGDVLAMVGSVNYNAPGFGNVNVTLAQLQPGSSFKPIAYATAFKKGWSGATHVDDTPFSAISGDGSVYTPQNYDGKFRGPVSLRRALGNSLNIPAIKVLQHAGIHDTIQTAHDMGITSLQDESRFGLALVLGGGEVRPIDMATVYATFANSGTKTAPRSILRVSDRMGKDITTPRTTQPQKVLDPRIAYMITNILSDNSARTEEFGPTSPLKLSRPAAAKTGTTNDFRDNWTVGYTPQLVTAVWVGNNDHSAMNNVDGITGAAPIWHDYMERALAGTPALSFMAPEGVTTAKVCQHDGGLANPWDAGYDEVFMSDAVPTKHCASQPKPAEGDTPDPNNPFTGFTFPEFPSRFENPFKPRIPEPYTQ